MTNVATVMIVLLENYGDCDKIHVHILLYLQVGADSLVDITGGLSEDLEQLRNDIISTPTPTPGDNEDDDDDELSGGIIALIVILVVLTVIVLVAVIVGLLVYRSKNTAKFEIKGSVKQRVYGSTDYISNRTAVNISYVSKQELQASNIQEMASNEPEPYKTETGDSLVKQNLGANDDIDTHL